MRRSLIWAALLLAGVLPGTSSPASAQTLVPPILTDSERPRQQGDCKSGASLVCAGQELVDAGVGAATDVVGAGVEAAGGAVFGGLVSWVGDGAAWLVRTIGKEIERSTRPQLGGAWFGRQYATTSQLAVALSIVFLLLAVLQATIQQDATMLARSALVALPMALLLTFASMTLVEAALGVTDWMTAVVLRGFRHDSRETFEDLAEILVPASLTGNPLPGFLVFLGGIVTALLCLLVWLELVMREAAIYVAVAFLPLTFVAMVWGKTAHWSRKLAGWLGAIIISKFTIATAFALAAGALGDARGGASGGLTALLAGCAVLLLAALTPWVVLAIVPFGDAAAGRGLHRTSVQHATHMGTGRMAAGMAVRQAMTQNFSGSGGTSGQTSPPPAPATSGGHIGVPAAAPELPASGSTERFASIATTSSSADPAKRQESRQ